MSTFKLPQQQLATIIIGQAVNLTADAFAGVKFAARSRRSIRAWTRAPATFRRRPPSQCGGASCRECCPGRRPGGDVKHYLTLPQTAITYNRMARRYFSPRKDGGTDKDLVAQQSFVTLGRRAVTRLPYCRESRRATWSCQRAAEAAQRNTADRQ